MKTRNRTAMLGLIAASLMACSQSSPDTTAPTVLSSTPTNAATGVATSASLSVHFSEAMDKTTVTVTSSPAINLGAPVWNDAQTVVFSPPVAWQLGASYTIGIEGKDPAGNALSGTKTFSFQTVLAPDSTPPATPSGIKATPGDGAFSLEWKANAEADLEGYTVYWGEAANALVNANFMAKPTTITSIKNLTNTKAYFYAVDAVDASGNHSVKSSPASVTPTDKTAPTLKSSEPANGTQDISLVPNVRLTFSEPMNTALEIGSCTTTDPPATATCANPALADLGTPTWTNGDTVVQFSNLTSAFPGGKTYVLKLSAKDKAGNALGGRDTVAFAVRTTPDATPPSVTDYGFLPNDPTGRVQLEFSEPMDQVSVQNAFLSEPKINCTWTWQGNTAFCDSTGPLEQLKTYTVTIGTLAKDTAGNALAVPFQFAFTTPNFAPRVTKFAPDPGALNRFFAPNAPIILTFNEPMDTTTVQSAFLVKAGATIIAGHFSWSESPAGSNTVMQFDPSLSYGNGAIVTWKLAYFASDATQIPMTADVTHSFQTQPVIAP